VLYWTIFLCFFFNLNSHEAALACPQQHRLDHCKADMPGRCCEHLRNDRLRVAPWWWVNSTILIRNRDATHWCLHAIQRRWINAHSESLSIKDSRGSTNPVGVQWRLWRRRSKPTSDCNCHHVRQKISNACILRKQQQQFGWEVKHFNCQFFDEVSRFLNEQDHIFYLLRAECWREQMQESSSGAF
jgi:hypothetical protein